MALDNELTAGLSPHISRRSSKFSEKSFPLPDLDQGSTAFWYPRLSSVILILTLLYPSFICFSSILDFLLHSSISSLVKLSVWYSFMAFGRKSVGGHFSHHFSQPRVKCFHVSSQSLLPQIPFPIWIQIYLVVKFQPFQMSMSIVWTFYCHFCLYLRLFSSYYCRS